MDPKELYHAALLHLLQQTQNFCQAFNHTRILAEQYDPQGELHDELAQQVVQGMMHEFAQQLALNPGFREFLQLVLQG